MKALCLTLSDSPLLCCESASALQPGSIYQSVSRAVLHALLFSSTASRCLFVRDRAERSEEQMEE